MKKLKILQEWPLLHNGKELNRGDVAEFDDKYADWLLTNDRAEADKSLKTGGNNSAQASAAPETSEQENQAERQAKIQAAVAEMLTADPEATPKCPDIAAKTGLLNIRKEERDAAVAAFKQAAAGNETEESQGE